MPSHAALRLLRETPRDGRLDVQLVLACGCTVEKTVPPDRVLERPDGTRFAVGKYPCPLGHPVKPPP